MKTILAAIDFSAVTTRVLAEAFALARGAHSGVLLLNVTTPKSIVRDYGALEALLKGAEREQKNGSESQEMTAIRGDYLQVTGDPVNVILQQAARCSADYIVLGSHGHSALFEALVGGTAARVIKGAKCPVIVVPSLEVRNAEHRREQPPRRRYLLPWLKRNKERTARTESSVIEVRRPAWTAP